MKKQTLITEKRVHSLKYKAFYDKLRNTESNTVTFTFDCQKNLVLPKAADQIAYYSRQLYIYNFTICQGSSKSPLNKETVKSYTWTEDEYNKVLMRLFPVFLIF